MTEDHDNYINYFTKIEEHFQNVRGTALFRLSPVDWALVQRWKDAEVPLEAVLRGIDTAFENWRSRKSQTQMVNSLAYCAQAVMAEARVMANALPSRAMESKPTRSLDDLRHFLSRNSEVLREQPNDVYHEIATALNDLAARLEQYDDNLEQLERHLTALEDKMVLAARMSQTEEQLLSARGEMDRQLRPYRDKMSPEQLAMLEKQYLDRRLLDDSGLPRLSLFYLQ